MKTLFFSFLTGVIVAAAILEPETKPSQDDRAASDIKRVTGIGGVFFKAKDPAKMREWYSKHLGLKVDKYGSMFEWRRTDEPHGKAYTQWSPFSEKTKYFHPSQKEFMINYQVENLERLLPVLKAEGVTVVDTMETYSYGKFVHIMDIEGNKIELWEPGDTTFAGNTTH